MKKKGKAMIIIGVIFLVGALGLTGFNVVDAMRAGKNAESLLESIESSMEEQSPDFTKRKDNDAVPEMPTKEIDGNRYIGVIEIPSLSVSLPVFAEWNYDLLKLSPCYYSGSYYTNDLVLCAHNYRSHFGRLRRTAIGTDIYFTAVSGGTYHYIVSNRETLKPDENDRMITSDGTWDLTLFTCYTGGRTRCTLRCTLAKTES